MVTFKFEIMNRSRNWCFTLNNPTFEEEVGIQSLDCKYVTFGHEVGSECQTPHLQGFINFSDKKSLKQVSTMLPRCHLEEMKGTQEQAIAYCHKEDPAFYEKGSKPASQAKKGEMGKQVYIDAITAAKEDRLEDIDPVLFLKYYSTLKTIRKDYMVKPPDSDDVTGIWIYGPAGCGKSRKAREDYPESYFKLANKWWDGYDNQSTVISDDWDMGHSVLGYHLKIWADRYSFIAETKGGALHIRPSKIIITSQYLPSQIWSESQETQDAINRRFKIVDMSPASSLPPSASSKCWINGNLIKSP